MVIFFIFRAYCKQMSRMSYNIVTSTLTIALPFAFVHKLAFHLPNRGKQIDKRHLNTEHNYEEEADEAVDDDNDNDDDSNYLM